MRASIETTLALHLLTPEATPQPVRTVFLYDEKDPLVVRLVFNAGSENPVTWRCSRDLLLKGCYNVDPNTETGEGDLRVTAAAESESIVIGLHTPRGQASFEGPRVEMISFLERTYQAVTPSKESNIIGRQINRGLRRLFPRT